MDPKALRELFTALRERSKGTLARVEFAKADLRGAHLLRADLVNADLREARLDHANLEGARLGGARLQAASLCGASLNGADLTEADLQGADLAEARVEGACLAGADLRGARLELIAGQPATLSGARIDLAMCQRSGLSDAAIIQWWRVGAALVDLDSFSEAVQRACQLVDVADDEGPLESRRLIEAELSARQQRLRKSQSIPPSNQRLAAWTQLSQPPPAIKEMASEGDALVLHVPALPALGLDADELPPPSLSRPTSPAFQPGEKLFGARLLEQIGSGENGSVWRAELSDGQVVAIKCFDPSRATPGLGAPAFRRAVRALSRVMAAGSTVAVPKLYCVARNELSFVMEYYANGTATGIPALGWGVQRSLEFFEQLCREVEALHELGMVHRCIKPNNILIDAELRPVLTDLNGVDLQELAARGEYRLYAAPEELTGMGTESPTADIYSLGRVLHFLLLGTDPAPQLQDIPPLDSLTAAPVGLVRIIRKATVRDASMRYQWVSELLADLRQHEESDRVGLARSGPAPGEFFHALSSLPPAAPGPVAAPARATRTPQAATARPLDTPAAQEARAAAKARGPALSPALRRSLGLTGLAGLTVCVGFLLLVPTPGDQAASVLGVALTVSVALATVLIQVKGLRPGLFNLALAGLIVAVLLPAEPERIVLLRWRHTLSHGRPDQRALVARELARRAYRSFDGVDLSLADLSGADLGRVSLRNANLRGANLIGAVLHEADLGRADVSQANLTRADLFGSNAPDARGWPQAICDGATVMPTGWSCNDGQPGPAATSAEP
jgi:uncharacterized protein YjbI with pentapeptide repeats